MTDQNLAQAAQLAPIIERVHGAHHPELTRVREITLTLQQSNTDPRTAELFNELRTLTRNYAVPEDVCEAFRATYQALERADARYAA
ncbi:hypothetical protein GCM10022261_01410 [Brevibacterium daeguense]|uniref:Iron-sulfur cluster repair di-iron protein, ric n=1 Tax=Brevibacterium daeguense TaxID=909936 RepID=A0ABP8EF92_9MICO|nr:hypothetical protein [Brevibacterium daeguense]